MKLYEILTETSSEHLTLLSLLSEMLQLYGSGGVNSDVGILRNAITQLYDKGSADDSEKLSQQINFVIGSLKSRWMRENWPKLKSEFLQLSKNPRYRDTSAKGLLDKVINAFKNPEVKTDNLSQYFNTILTEISSVLSAMSKDKTLPEHVKSRAVQLSTIIPTRLTEFSNFKQHWINKYDEHPSSTIEKPTNDDKKVAGQQSKQASDVIDMALNALAKLPKGKELAVELRPQLQKIPSLNDRMTKLASELLKHGINPNTLLR